MIRREVNDQPDSSELAFPTWRPCPMAVRYQIVNGYTQSLAIVRPQDIGGGKWVSGGSFAIDDEHPLCPASLMVQGWGKFYGKNSY